MEKATGLGSIALADPEWGDKGFGPPPPPEKSQNIGFLVNTGLDPPKNHKATKPSFIVVSSLAGRWWPV